MIETINGRRCCCENDNIHFFDYHYDAAAPLLRRFSTAQEQEN
jgi:hypothetical protein